MLEGEISVSATSVFLNEGDVLLLLPAKKSSRYGNDDAELLRYTLRRAEHRPIYLSFFFTLRERVILLRVLNYSILSRRLV